MRKAQDNYGQFFVSDQPSLYLFTEGDSKVAEVLQFKEEFRSWFIGETVHKGRTHTWAPWAQGMPWALGCLGHHAHWDALGTMGVWDAMAPWALGCHGTMGTGMPWHHGRAVTSRFILYLSKSKSNPRKSYSSKGKSTSKIMYLKYK